MKKIHSRKIISLLMCLAILMLTLSASFGAVAVNTFAVYLPTGSGYATQAAPGYSVQNVERGSQFIFTLTLFEGYDKSVPTVLVNDQPVTATGGQYIITDIQTDLDVTVQNVVKNTYKVELPDTQYCSFAPAPGYNENSVIHGSGFKFIMDVKAAYTQSKPKVYLDGAELAPDKNNAYVIEGVTQDITGITVGEVPLNTYTLNFFNEDGSFLWRKTAYHGEELVYGGETPVKETDNQWIYDFSGWSPSLTEAEGDTSYAAVFTKRLRLYTVRFLNYDGSVIESYQVPYNGSAACTVIPERPADETGAYSFTQFDIDTSVVTRDIDTTARFEHKHIFRHLVVAPTCTESGYTYDHCASCGYGRTYDHTYALGHQCGPWIDIVRATADTDGLKARKCVRCDYTEEEIVPMGTVYPDEEQAGEEEEEHISLFQKILNFFKRLHDRIVSLFIK